MDKTMAKQHKEKHSPKGVQGLYDYKSASGKKGSKKHSAQFVPGAKPKGKTS